MDFNAENIVAIGKVINDLATSIGALLASVTSLISGFYTWKNRYELDQLYAQKFRPKADGSPGPMRRHPKFMVKLFKRKRK